MLEIKNLHVSVGEKEILHGVDLLLQPGKVVAVMGPNGSGKSTLANTLAGHPKYSITNGEIKIDGVDITTMKPDERAKKGLFLSMQHTPEIPGVSIANFLRLAKQAVTGETINPVKFYKELRQRMADLGIDPKFAERHLNVGFSGGEKKRFEILQLSVLQPKYAILDETDSGLDVDALKIVAEGINKFRNADKGILVITHYNRILQYVIPDEVYIMMNGRIVECGKKNLAERVEEHGYDTLR